MEGKHWTSGRTKGGMKCKLKSKIRNVYFHDNDNLSDIHNSSMTCKIIYANASRAILQTQLILHYLEQGRSLDILTITLPFSSLIIKKNGRQCGRFFFLRLQWLPCLAMLPLDPAPVAALAVAAFACNQNTSSVQK